MFFFCQCVCSSILLVVHNVLMYVAILSKLSVRLLFFFNVRNSANILLIMSGIMDFVSGFEFSYAFQWKEASENENAQILL